MKKTAKYIIEKGITRFSHHYDEFSADGGLHVLIGKIALAAELGLISDEEMDEAIDRVFAQHSNLRKRKYF